jgi:hypothetical protein
MEQMQEWELSNGDKFNFIDGLDLYNQLDKVSDDILKAQVKERMNLADIYVLIVNKTTKSYRRFIRWQVEHAINSGIPLIAINANGIRSVDYDRIPTVLKKNIAIHIAFQAKILEYAIQNWPSSFREYQAKEIKNSFKYSEEVYNQLGLETFDV